MCLQFGTIISSLIPMRIFTLFAFAVYADNAATNLRRPSSPGFPGPAVSEITESLPADVRLEMRRDRILGNLASSEEETQISTSSMITSFSTVIPALAALTPDQLRGPIYMRFSDCFAIGQGPAMAWFYDISNGIKALSREELNDPEVQFQIGRFIGFALAQKKKTALEFDNAVYERILSSESI
jgi:hypothetical protein